MRQIYPIRRYLYKNNRNHNKYIVLTRYQCGHYYIKQFIRNPITGAYNGTGGRTSRGRSSRVTVSTMLQVLEDYTLIASLPTTQE